jgi:hypothetical protein
VKITGKYGEKSLLKDKRIKSEKEGGERIVNRGARR